MAHAEREALAEGKTLLVLDTVTGDDAERLEESPQKAGGRSIACLHQSKRQPSPAANDFRIRRATTMRCTSSGPS